MRFLVLVLLMPLAVSASEIYVRDGVTDGDAFYLAPTAYADDDPAYQSWVTYSLMRSTCKLEMGGDNPARNSSFDCEFRARRHLATAWDEKKQLNPEIRDKYLDVLSDVNYEGYLAEYTMHFFGKRGWSAPDGLRIKAFREWRRKYLRGHQPSTRVVGSWNYQKNVTRPAY